MREGVTSKKPEGLSPRKLKEIWGQIPPADWLSFLQEHQPDKKWTISGKEIKGLCPYHTETAPSFHVYLEKGHAHCFGCEHHEWNPVKFYADISGMGYAGALRDIRKRFKIRLPVSYTQNAQQIEDNENLKSALYLAMHMEFTKALATPDAPEFDYIKKAGLIPWLRQRKFPEDVAHQWPIGVLPTRERLSFQLEDLGFKEFRDAGQKYLSDYLALPGNDLNFEGSLVLFCFLAPNTVGRIKLRKPNTKKIYVLEDPYTESIGFFGLNSFSHLLGKLDEHPLYVFEGELDALAVISNSLAVGRDDICSVATGGHMESDVELLTEYGFKDIRLVPDNDSGGISWAKAILSENPSVKRVFQWPGSTDHRISDIDEAIRDWGFEKAYECLTDEVNFPRNHEWAVEMFDRAVSQIDTDDIVAKTEKAAEFASILSEDAERMEYIDEVVKNYGLKKELVIMDVQISDDTSTHFAKRIANKLREEYHFISERQPGVGSAIVTAWSNRKKVMRTFSTSSAHAVRSVLELDLGFLEEYIKEELGEPDFLNYRRGPKGQPIPTTVNYKAQTLNTIFSQAISVVANTAIPRERLVELGQGIHYFDNYQGKPAVFIVNGTKFFKGVVDGDNVTYEELVCPISDEFVFRLASQPWSENIKSASDISDGTSYKPREIYEQVLDIVKRGWRFRNHDLESIFVAADIMYTSIAAIFNHMVMTDITGESHSGKTTLMQIIGGGEFPGYRLCESAIFIDDFSAAAVRQLMSGLRLRLLLDEFEDTDAGNSRTDKKSAAVREVLNSVRSLSSGVRSIRGTSGGDHQEFDMTFPLTIGGIYTMREHRDINRFVHIRTQFMEGFNDPIIPIKKKYSASDMQRIRRGITLCWLPRVPALLKTYEEVKAEFADNSSLPPGIYTRLKDNLLPAAAILKFVGHDYVSFMSEFSKLKMDEFAEQGSTKESSVIWSHILHTPVPLSHVDSGKSGHASVAKIISNHTLDYLLNESDLGAYFLKEKGWLVVFWQKAVSGVLQRSNMYRNAQYPARLKGVADADSRTIRKETLLRGNFLKTHLWPLVGAKISVDEISVIDVRETLAIRDAVEETVQKEAEKESMLDDIPEDIARGKF